MRADDISGKVSRSESDSDVLKCGRWSINRRLLPLKVFYFFFYGACGSVIPFVTVYLKHLQLTALETGLITGVSVFFAFFARTVIGMVADRLSAYKSSLIVCCFGFGASFFLLWFLPAREMSSTQPPTMFLISNTSLEPILPHKGSSETVWICENDRGEALCSYPSHKNLSTCILIATHLDDLNERQRNLKQRKTLSKPSEKLQTDSRALNTSSSGAYQDLSLKDAESSSNHKNVRVNGIAKRSIIRSNTPCFQTKDNNEYQQRPLEQKVSRLKITKTQENVFGNNDDSKSTYDLAMECLPNCRRVQKKRSDGNITLANEYEESSPSKMDPSKADHVGARPDVVFFISFLLLSVARAFYSSSTSLADTVTYTLLGTNRLQWGRQRLWGTIGTAVAVITLTSINDSLKGQKFSGLFLTGLILATLACLVAGFKLKADRVPKNSTFRRDMRKVLSNPFIRMFLVKLAFLGLMCGSAQNFFLWFMVDLGSSQTLLGLTVLTHCLSSVFVLRFTARVIKRIGQIRTMYLVMGAYVVRYLTFSFLPSAWWALPVELLHGVTYSMLWAAASSMTSLIAPSGTQATCQALTGAVYWDFGRGLGNLITGQLLYSLGARWTFRLYAAICACMLPLFFLLDRKWSLPETDQGKTTEQEIYAANEDSSEDTFTLRPSSLPDGNLSLSSIDMLSSSPNLSISDSQTPNGHVYELSDTTQTIRVSPEKLPQSDTQRKIILSSFHRLNETDTSKASSAEDTVKNQKEPVVISMNEAEEDGEEEVLYENKNFTSESRCLLNEKYAKEGQRALNTRSLDQDLGLSSNQVSNSADNGRLQKIDTSSVLEADSQNLKGSLEVTDGKISNHFSSDSLNEDETKSCKDTNEKSMISVVSKEEKDPVGPITDSEDSDIACRSATVVANGLASVTNNVTGGAFGHVSTYESGVASTHATDLITKNNISTHLERENSIINRHGVLETDL